MWNDYLIILTSKWTRVTYFASLCRSNHRIALSWSIRLQLFLNSNFKLFNHLHSHIQPFHFPIHSQNGKSRLPFPATEALGIRNGWLRRRRSLWHPHQEWIRPPSKEFPMADQTIHAFDRSASCMVPKVRWTQVSHLPSILLLLYGCHCYLISWFT